MRFFEATRRRWSLSRRRGEAASSISSLIASPGCRPARITASSIVLSIAGPEGFGVHPLYVFLAVGYGATGLSWMNDSGFWVFSRLGGLKEGETLRSWSVLLTIISVVGLLQTLVASAIWPNLWF